MAKTISELRNQSIQVRDASAAGENTATRVGTVLNDIVGHIEDYENTQSSNNSSQDAKIEGVKSSLNAEIARAKTEESNLSTQIGTERTERQAAVSREETARIQADNAEQDARIKADNDEKTARENADITLRAMIQTEVSNRQIAVKQEEIRAMAAEKANTQAIEDETARATTAEAAETARAKAEEERLQGEIDNTNDNLNSLEDKVNSNHDHLTDEVARLDMTDAEIKADLEAEVARAQAAEETTAQAITDEMARAQAAEQANAQAITDEMARAQAAEQANAQAITDEMARAQAAEQANAQAINVSVLKNEEQDQKLSELEVEVVNIKGYAETNQVTTIDTETWCNVNVELKKGIEYTIQASGVPKDTPMLLRANSASGIIIVNYFYCDTEYKYIPTDDVTSIWLKPRSEATKFGVISISIAVNGLITDLQKSMTKLDEDKAEKTEVEILKSSIQSLNAPISAASLYEIKVVDEFPYAGYYTTNGVWLESSAIKTSGYVKVTKGDVIDLSYTMYGGFGVVCFDESLTVDVAKSKTTVLPTYNTFVVPEGITLVRFTSRDTTNPKATLKNAKKDLESRVESLEKNNALDIVQLRKTKVIDGIDDFVCDGSNISKNYTLGVSKIAYLPVGTNIENFTYKVIIKIKMLNSYGHCNFSFGKYLEGVSHATISVVNGNLNCKGMFNGTEKDYTSVIIDKKGTMPAISVGKTLMLEIKKNVFTEDNKETRFSISDGTNTLSGVFARGNAAYITAMWGCPFVRCDSGEIEVSDISFSAPYNPLSKVMIWGHSYVEGSSLVGNTTTPWLKKRFVSLYAEEVGTDDVVISGLGGRSFDAVELQKFKDEYLWYKSEYVIICMGANDLRDGYDNYINYLEQSIDFVKKYGGKPILVTLNARNDIASSTYQTFRTQVNAWVRNSGERYIDISAALSVSPDGDWISDYVLSDGVHPTEAGHLAVYERMKFDVPELFEV